MSVTDLIAALFATIISVIAVLCYIIFMAFCVVIAALITLSPFLLILGVVWVVAS